MFDERLVFYGLTIFLIVSCIKMLFEVDAETSIPKWANGKIVNGAILGLNSIIFFIIILSMVISDFPMIANTASSTRTGIVVSCTRRGTNVSPGKWRVNKYDFTIKDSATGDEIDFEDARVQELSVGMQVEVRQFQTKSLDSVVEKINGVTTEYFKQTFCESNTEKIGVFLGLLIIALIVMGKISYDYFRQSGRKKGTAWYVVSIIGSIFYILFSWFGMQEIKGNIYAEIGIGIQICLEIFCGWNLFRT